MAVISTLALPALTRIAAQISAAMPGALFLGGATGVPSEVGESLDVYALGADAIQGNATLRDIARPLESFFHLVYQNDQPAGHARSDFALGGPAAPQVTEVSNSPELASLVRRALVGLDAAFPADTWKVSLLMVPAYQVVALWVRTMGHDPAESRVCVLQSGSKKVPVNNTNSQRVDDLTLPETAFLAELAHSERIEGLGP